MPSDSLRCTGPADEVEAANWGDRDQQCSATVALWSLLVSKIDDEKGGKGVAALVGRGLPNLNTLVPKTSEGTSK